MRLGALKCLLRFATAEPFQKPEPFALRLPGMFADECLDSPEATVARLIAAGTAPHDIAAALGVDLDIVACPLLDICRGARVGWTPKGRRAA